jgi:hypothetical protein
MMPHDSTYRYNPGLKRQRLPTADAEMRKISHKQQKFINAYLGAANGNATEAAKLAGYKGNRHTLQAIGSENLSKPVISEAINRAMAKSAAGAKESLLLLSRIARMPAPEGTNPIPAIALLLKVHGLTTKHARRQRDRWLDLLERKFQGDEAAFDLSAEVQESERIALERLRMRDISCNGDGEES